MVKIKVNEMIKVEVDFKDEIDAKEFLGLVDGVAKMIRKNVIYSDDEDGGEASSYRMWTQEETDKLILMTREGIKPIEIARQLDMEPSKVYAKLSKLRKDGVLE